MARARSAAGLLTWTATLVAGTWAFHTLGDTGLAAPPWRVDEFATWLTMSDPTLATMSLLRLLVLAVSWYLIGVTTVGGLARLAGAVRLVRLTDALTVPAVRRLLQSALGVGLATAMVAGATPARAQPLPLQLLESAESAAAAEDPASAPSPDPTAALAPTNASAPDPPAAEPATAHAAPAVAQHTVVAGESFWRIAAEFLEQRAGSPPPDAEVVVYWRRLIEHNRDRLAVPGNPDLIFPGQQLLLPTAD